MRFLLYQNLASGLKEVIDIPQKVIPAFRRTSTNSILSYISNTYGMENACIEKSPLIIHFHSSEESDITLFVEHCQNGTLSTVIWNIISKEKYFQENLSKGNSYYVVLDVDYDKLEKRQNSSASESDCESITSEPDIYACPYECNGACLMTNLMSNDANRNVNTTQSQRITTISETLSLMVKTRTNSYSYSRKDIFAFIQKHR